MKHLLTTLLVMPLMAFASIPDHVTYTEEYVTATAPGQDVAAAYMTIQNSSDKAITIKTVTSPNASEVMIHDNVKENGTVKMVALKTLEIPAHGSVALQPGGKHVMLMGLKKPFSNKDTITLIFTYSDDSKSMVRSIPVKDIR